MDKQIPLSNPDITKAEIEAVAVVVE